MSITTWLKKLRQRRRSRQLQKKIEAGLVPRGRTFERVAPDGLMEGFCEMTGALSAKVIRKNGQVEDLGVIARKKVTTAFVNHLVDSLQDQTATAIDTFEHHDAGTGTTAESNSDTALVTPWGGSRVAGTQTEGASANIYKTVATISFTGTYAITEHGVFSAATGGTLMDRSVFSAINVVNGDSIEFTYELTCNAET